MLETGRQADSPFLGGCQKQTGEQAISCALNYLQIAPPTGGRCFKLVTKRLLSMWSWMVALLLIWDKVCGSALQSCSLQQEAISCLIAEETVSASGGSSETWRTEVITAFIHTL